MDISRVPRAHTTLGHTRRPRDGCLTSPPLLFSRGDMKITGYLHGEVRGIVAKLHDHMACPRHALPSYYVTLEIPHPCSVKAGWFVQTLESNILDLPTQAV